MPPSAGGPASIPRVRRVKRARSHAWCLPGVSSRGPPSTCAAETSQRTRSAHCPFISRATTGRASCGRLEKEPRPRWVSDRHLSQRPEKNGLPAAYLGPPSKVASGRYVRARQREAQPAATKRDASSRCTGSAVLRWARQREGLPRRVQRRNAQPTRMLLTRATHRLTHEQTEVCKSGPWRERYDTTPPERLLHPAPPYPAAPRKVGMPLTPRQ